MVTPNQIPTIDPLTTVSLHLELYRDTIILGSGTGFIVTLDMFAKGESTSKKPSLVTNWHVLSGRDPTSNEPLRSDGLADPTHVKIWHHHSWSPSGEGFGQWIQKTEPLKDGDGKPRWIEHPLGQKIDVVALPITDRENALLARFDLRWSQADLPVSPSEPVSIIGFPYGQAVVGKFPIWKTGHIASDLDLDYEELPVFLIDADTRQGMSGSPVFAVRIGSYRTSKGFAVGGRVNRFLGVYSGRKIFDDMSSIGRVWKASVVEDIISAGLNPKK